MSSLSSSAVSSSLSFSSSRAPPPPLSRPSSSFETPTSCNWSEWIDALPDDYAEPAPENLRVPVADHQYQEAMGKIVRLLRDTRQRRTLRSAAHAVGYAYSPELVSYVRASKWLAYHTAGDVVEFVTPYPHITDARSLLLALKKEKGFVVRFNTVPYLEYEKDIDAMVRTNQVYLVTNTESNDGQRWPAVFLSVAAAPPRYDERLVDLWHSVTDIPDSVFVDEGAVKPTVAWRRPDEKKNKKLPPGPRKPLTNVHLVGKGHEWLDAIHEKQQSRSRPPAKKKGGGGGLALTITPKKNTKRKRAVVDVGDEM